MAKIESKNNHIITGRLAADAVENGSVIKFDLLHNMGKTKTGESIVLAKRIVVFTKKNGKDVEVNRELLKKGSAVEVSYFERPNNFVNSETGEKTYRTECVAKSIIAATEVAADSPAEDETASEEK